MAEADYSTDVEAQTVYTTEAPAPTSTPYWLRPFFLLVCTLGIPTAVTWALPDEVFQQQWNCAKYFSGQDAAQIAVAIACFGLGTLIWGVFRHISKTDGTSFSEIQSETVSPFFRIGFFLCAGLSLLGSAIWAAFALKQGITIGDALSALRGSSDAVVRIRQQAETITGVTTFTQFGMAAGVFAGILWNRPRNRSVRWTFYTVLIVSLLRAFMRAERLALIEVAVPFGVSVLPELISRARNSRLLRLSIRLMPVLAVCGLMAFFIIAELGRSYSAKLSSGLDQGPIYYGAVRIGGYYGTALNNGAYLAPRLPKSEFPFFFTDWFWRFPGVSLILNPRDITGMNGSEVGNLLDADLNMEFNNPSGFFCYQHDFGHYGMLVMSALFGLLAGRLYISYKHRLSAGRLFYPMIVLGLLEIARIPYLTGGRAFPSIFVLLVFALLDRAVQHNAARDYDYA